MPVKVLTASGQVSARRIVVHALNVQGGSDAMTAALADKATAGGTEVLGWGAAAGVSDRGPDVGPGTIFETACYATLTGTSPKIWVVYSILPGGNVS